MIIKNVFIERFGCLENMSIDFEDGINVISMSNEGGKTTIAEFIRVMLYGVNSLRFNQRKKYMPFGSSVMSGEITVRCGDAEYVIHRSFGNRKSDDRIDVYNKFTSARLDEYCVDNIGEILCGINGDTFENTCYVKQLACSVDETKTSEIQSKLINLSQSGNENYSYRNAVSILDAEIRELSKPRGKINIIQGQINELAVRRSEKQKIKAEAERCKQELDELKCNGVIQKFKLSAMLFYIPALIFLICAVGINKLFGLLAFVLAVIGVCITLKMRKNTNQQLEIAKKTGFLESRIQGLMSDYEKIDITEFDELTARLEYYNNALKDLVYAKETLAEAFEQLSMDYSPKLNDMAKKVFKDITGGKYTEFMADDKYNISVRDSENRIVSSEYLSSGAFDQIYFSLRMALAQLIADDVPIILDDAFAMYDDKRLVKALEYLQSVKKQVIIFTCHSREKDILRNYI